MTASPCAAAAHARSCHKRKLLYKLSSFPGQIFTRQQLMDDIWGVDSETDAHTVDVHIGRLRERLRDNPDLEIVTVRGLGYKAVRKND